MDFDNLTGADLVIDRTYRGGSAGGTRDDPLSKLLPVGNQGGFRSVPASLGQRVSDALRIPTVGIGAGPHCGAQILVWQDMAGLTTGRLHDSFSSTRTAAASRYATDAAAGHYPGPAHSYQ